MSYKGNTSLLTCHITRLATPSLHIHPTVRVVRVVAVPRPRAVRVPVAVVAAPAARAVLVVVVVAEAAAVREGHNGSHEEEDDVDDAQGEAGLEHGAALRGAPGDAHAGPADAHVAEVDGPVVGAVDADVDAVGRGDAAEEVDARDEAAEDEGVDDGDEVGIALGAVVEDEGEEGPGEGDDGDDEEDEDRVGGQGVCACETLDEPGEHAHDGDQCYQLEDAVGAEDDSEKHGGRVLRANAT